MKYKILVVEDSKVIASSIKNFVEEDSNFQCEIATSLVETKDKLVQFKGKFDVAILDLSLPDALNGEVVNFVTKFKIPTIILTSSVLDDNDEKLQNEYVIDYVVKDGQYSFKYAVSVVKRVVKNPHTKVLIVDDSKVFLESMSDLVSKYKLQVYKASNGEEAMKILLSNNDIKVVFTDYNMPKMDGLALTRAIRTKYSKDELAIIVNSSIEDKKIASKFLKYGANDFLYKGFSKEEFYTRLNVNLEVLELFSDVKDRANKDFLTGLFNRRYLFDVGSEIFERIKNRNDESLCVAIIDIDKFKSINDTYGHDIGDLALVETAKLLNDNLSNSLIARLGGEEFCLLLKGRTSKEAAETLDNLRETFEKNSISFSNKELKFTISVGVCSELKGSLEQMIRFADQALYEAKNNGRNRIEYYESWFT